MPSARPRCWTSDHDSLDGRPSPPWQTRDFPSPGRLPDPPKKSPPRNEAGFQFTLILCRLFDEGVRRGRNRIRQVVIIGLHRNDLRWRLRPRRLLGRNPGYRENDAAMNRIDLENSEIEVHRLVDDVRGAAHRLAEVELAHRNEAFDVIADIDDH